jgi:hypothetical protein
MASLPIATQPLMEQRVAVRYPANPESMCQVLDPKSGQPWPAWVRDVSLTGICLLLEPHFEPGQRLPLEVHNPGKQFFRRIVIEVKHSDILCPNDAWLHGCAFERPLSEEELLVLVALTTASMEDDSHMLAHDCRRT